MGLLDNGFRMSTGLAVGVGVIILAPIITPILASIARPLMKAGIKGGMILLEKGREAIAETAEVVEDLVVEAKAELAGGFEAARSASSTIVEG